MTVAIPDSPVKTNELSSTPEEPKNINGSLLSVLGLYVTPIPNRFSTVIVRDDGIDVILKVPL